MKLSFDWNVSVCGWKHDDFCESNLHKSLLCTTTGTRDKKQIKEREGKNLEMAHELNVRHTQIISQATAKLGWTKEKPELSWSYRL